MSQNLHIFGSDFTAPRDLRRSPRPPRPWPSQLLSVLVTASIVFGAVGVIYYAGDDSPNPAGGTTVDDSGYLMSLGSDRSRSSPQLVAYDSCAALETDLKTHIAEELRVTLAQNQYYYLRGPMWAEDSNGMLLDGGAETADAGGAPQREKGEDFSGTNNQEQGVEEADFVKTDGYHLYLLNGRRLAILGVPEFGALTYESNLTLEGSPREMLLAGDRLVVLSSVYTYNLPDGDPLRLLTTYDTRDGYWRATSLTKLTVIDITDRTAPTVARELYLEGWYLTAREVSGTVRMISHGYLDTPGLRHWVELPQDYWQLDYNDPQREMLWNASFNATLQYNERVLANLTLDELMPRLYERSGGEVTTHPFTADGCAGFTIAEDGMSRGFTSIFTLDLFDAEFAFEADHLMSNWPQVYASTDTLLIAEQAQDWWWFWGNDNFDEATNLHAFDISVPGETSYIGSGRFNGTVLDQFSLSEYDGFLRVASTTGRWNRWWLNADEQTGPENHVWVLAPATSATGPHLATVGHIGGIAVGEQIWSMRFVGDKGYMVTFRNIDPLWTIDLSDPTNPSIVGELEVPGVSTYIHPMDDGHLLTIGLGPGADGEGLDWSTTQISQFDVTNFSAPALVDALPLSPVNDDGTQGWRWAWSEATYEHKAFQYWAPKNLLAVPLSTYRYHGWYDDNDRYYYTYEYVSQLVLVNATPGADLTIHGTVDHADFYNTANYWWSSYNIRRSVFMGDYIYAISAGGVTVHDLDDMTLQVALPLDPGWNEYDYAIAEG